MFRVVFTSTLQHGIGAAEIRAIIDRAARRNSELDVTGVWLIKDRECLTALEGPPHQLRELVEQIWDDRRHFDFTIVHMGQGDQRLFPDWSFRQLTRDDFLADPSLASQKGLTWLDGQVDDLGKFVRPHPGTASKH